jgi:hypothetical protein
MRFMILRKADAVTESGTLPGRDLLAAMGKYREDLMQAGVWRGGEGLLASVTGARLTFCGGRTSVTDGPFAESKELIAGFLVLDVASIDEAIAWARRCPTLTGDGNVEIEVRQVIEATDFPDGLTAELSRMPWATVAAEANRRLRSDRGNAENATAGTLALT